MADQNPIEGSSTSNVSGESSESIVELNIKTLDSQMYSFHVDKDMPVSAFKEKIASQIGVPVGQQRLIFRGKVLKDSHLLSEYQVENGHTLHLVERQPSQPQPSAGTSSEETTANNGTRGQEPSGGGLRNRVGQISHSVVLGTFNVGDQEGTVPDLSRVIGAVLNSIGIGNQTVTNGTGGTQSSAQFNPPIQAPQGNETEGLRGNVGIQSQAGYQSQPRQAFPSPLPQPFQFPIGAAMAVPSLNVPIPDSLHTLTEFMNRMELALSQNGFQPDQSLNNTGDRPMGELPSNSRGGSTPEALSIVLRHAHRLLGGHATAALSHIAGRLEQEAGSADSTARGQIQAESVQVGLAMQHLGSLLLELGRTILTLRMGQYPAESSVNAGPAVYISPSGPNPIMVQPFPLQTSSFFGGSAVPPSNSVAFGPVGIGNVPRHINIHIHTAVGTRATNAEGMQQGERVNGAASGDSVIAEVNSQIRNFVNNMRSENQAQSGQTESSTVQDQSRGSIVRNEERSDQLGNSVVNGVGETSLPLPGVPEMEDQKTQSECHQPSNNNDSRDVASLKDVPSSSSVGGDVSCSGGEMTLKPLVNMEGAPASSQGIDNVDGSTAVPLGLGLGGLQPKKRSRQQRSQGLSGDGATSNTPTTQDQDARTDGQKVLQSLASLASRRNANTPPSGQLPHSAGGVLENMPSGGRSAIGQFDASGVMSQVLHSPALNGLLSGVSQQTGVGSPDVLRNMLEQLTQSPAMMNTVNQIAQQIDSQDIGNVFSGLGVGQGGGIDLSRMVQQMMPIVSQALSGGSTVPQPILSAVPDRSERMSSRDERSFDQNSQTDLQQAAQRIEHHNPPGDIFRSVVESVVQSYHNGSGVEGVVDELCTEEGLADEYMEMLRRDISGRVETETGSVRKP
ncbi:unnamed protein product [Ilex paraguariensis]|uniref:Ubiquitin-like domain-containing protein n=1 Tax=Ilex paraguariensis TaxID=185542 RepID=A0ABC8V3J4_9AQUA